MCDVLKRSGTSLFIEMHFKTMRLEETKRTISRGRGLGYDSYEGGIPLFQEISYLKKMFNCLCEVFTYYISSLLKR